MRFHFTILFFGASFIFENTILVNGQNETKYFQQEVNYHIHVQLNDVHHFLRGNISIEYTNHSPDTLHFLYFHLWPNAFKNNTTAFAKQMVENGSTEFYYASDSDRGFIDSLEFVIDGKPASYKLDSLNIDIAKVFLPSPLTPEQKISLATPFRVKIPYSFSRLGHVRQQYQISQWYPKPAVYDRYGWHPIPYLDQGEFYSEFGSFDVEITLPKNYVVGATGTLETKSEEKWMEEKALSDTLHPAEKNISPKEKRKQQKQFPPSSLELKTIRYTAANVHDFAWFADKRYEVRKSSVKLPYSNQEASTWALFLPENEKLWSHAVTFADSSLFYYSKWLGDYPYPQETIVDGALSAGGGMEYPMITVISGALTYQDLDDVITHEVGHNWLYGVLGFNERDHPWMDEGINSYYENRYLKTRYPGAMIIPFGFEQIANLFDLNYRIGYQNYVYYLYEAAQRRDQALNLKSTDYTETNYAAMLYSKTPIVFDYLEKTVGTKTFDSIVHAFYEQWKFKHPYPEDFKSFFKKATTKDVSWCFDQLLTTTNYEDYKLAKEDVGLKVGNASYAQIVVKNQQQIDGPFSIAAFKDGKNIIEKYFEGFSGKKTLQFPDGDYDYFRIDPEFIVPEINRNNNYLRQKGILKKTEPLRLQWLASIDNPNRTQIFFTPLTGVNYYDGFTPGIALYNSVFFPKKVNVLLMSQYGTRSNSFVGLGSVSIPFYLKESFLHTITFTSAARSYHFDQYTPTNISTEYDMRYMRFTQWLTLDFRKKNPRSNVNQSITYRNIFLRQQYITAVDASNKSLPYTNGTFNTITYSYNDHSVINPFDVSATTEFGSANHDDYVKIFGEGNFTLTYPRKKTGLGIRVFGGLFLKSPVVDEYKFRLSATTGLDDYLFDDVFLGRGQEEGVYAQQISVADDGGFKVRTNQSSPRIGQSSKWVLSLNLKIPVPFFTPIFVFADGGFSPEDESNSFAGYDIFQYDAGVGITVVPKIIEVYLPLFFSPDIQKDLIDMEYYEHWYQRITFTISLEKINPFEKARNITL